MTNINSVYILDLVRHDVVAKKVASTKGGEYAGECPFCGGNDRFRVQPNHPSGRGRFWCRQCDASGDAIDYIRRRDNVSYLIACQTLGIEENKPMEKPDRNSGIRYKTEVQSSLVEPVDPPSLTWQCRASDFIAYAGASLWWKEGRQALQYLRDRGLTDDTIKAACIGYNPKDIRIPSEQFGISEDKPIYLSGGIVFPNYSKTAANPDGRAETLWGGRIRRIDPEVKPKYISVKGSQMALYNCDTITKEKPIILVEGEIDALTIAQQIPEVTAVATGSTMACRRLRWVTLLNRASLVLVSYDADDAGEKASQWWLDTIGEKAKRWRPWWDDANALHTAGVNLYDWLAPVISFK